jgi:ATP-binding cassette, subfamily B, multidrug efflux pump
MGMVSIDSVLNILNNEVPKADLVTMTEDQKQALKQATLTVKNLSYRYPEKGQDGGDKPSENKLVLNNISFTIEAGKKVGVLGSIGSGKSTLVNCLNHHLDVGEGQIFWGDVDITKMSRQNWRTYVRTMTQQPYLFSDTIFENVQFGAAQDIDNRTDGDVGHVLELSQLSDDIYRFSEGEQTLVGEKGIMLSGGQKQRLSIARALLTPSDLIIMDNVLSAVDYETERKILEGVFNRMKDQSLLVVSHRISALENLDQILVLDKGEIIARGNHSELLLSSQYYRATWQLQQHEPEHIA